jgi:preprotein translocase subunit SecE
MCAHVRTFIASPCGSPGRGTVTTGNQVRRVTDAVGSIDKPDADDESPDLKPRKGGKRGKKGPLGRLALFYRQVVAELRKVVWPTRNQLSTYTTVVIVFVVIMIGLVTVIDYGFQEAIKFVFG